MRVSTLTNSLLVLTGALLLFGCVERGELIDPGQEMSFGVSLTVDNKIAVKFAPVRVLVEERGVTKDGKAGQLGYTSVSPVAGTRNYRITLPESYKGQAAVFVVEFRKINSAFDDIAALQKVPIARDLLKSRYVEIEGLKIPEPSESEPLALVVKDLENNEDDDLKLGYGPGGLLLSDIPNVPPIYIINLIEDAAVKEFEFYYSGGLATAYETEQYPPFDELVTKLRDTANIYGLTSPMLDDYLIMLPDVYTEGTPFSLFLYAKPQGKCPCNASGSTCSCISGLCPYKDMLNSNFGLDYYPVHIQIDETAVADLKIGEIITINLTKEHFLSCEDLSTRLPTLPVDLPPITDGNTELPVGSGP
ncbi:MAG: hypothetical protein LBB22_03670 [Treponema sp.]|jgi:hypothetical protein|nr:hypothetical protein [Treponema sp.]